MQVNTVTAGQYNFVVKGENRPFSNNFVVQNAKVGVVLCTNNSREPGRKYFVQYSTQGRLQVCNTLN